MKKISGSASRITLLFISASLCAGLFTNHVPVDVFTNFAAMVFTYYFVAVGTK